MNFGILSFDIGNKFTITTVVEHAMKVEEAGLKRFWLGEHYSSAMWGNPETLLPIILGMTEKINVGAAGILLNMHSTYRVASSFKMMNAFFPGRVDLGIAKGSATENFIELLHDFQDGVPNPLNQKIEKLFDFYHNEMKYIEKGTIVHPVNYPAPDVWMLGLSYNGLKDTLKYNCHFSRSLFHGISNHKPLIDDLNEFRDNFAAKHSNKPKVNIAIAGVVADTEAEANKLYKASVWGENTFIKPNILGTHDQFRAYTAQLEEKYDVDEFIFLDLSPSMENKYETIELMSNIQASVKIPELRA